MKRMFIALLALFMLAIPASAQQDPNFFIYLCFGQSNMEAGAVPADQDKDFNDPRFQFVSAVDMPRYERKMGEWYTAVPPICRQSNNMGPVDFFGRKMIEVLPEKYRVGVVNVSVAGAKLELFVREQRCKVLECHAVAYFDRTTAVDGVNVCQWEILFSVGNHVVIVSAAPYNSCRCLSVLNREFCISSILEFRRSGNLYHYSSQSWDFDTCRLLSPSWCIFFLDFYMAEVLTIYTIIQ